MFYGYILGIVFLYLYSIYPGRVNKDKMEPFSNRHYAHRGLFDKKSNPENSLPSFQLAIDKGYGIELDVRITKDDIPVVFHDLNLLRACGVDKNISDLNYKELQDLYLFESNQRIPLFKNVLSTINGQVPIIVEIKLDKGVGTEICQLITPLLDNYNGIYSVESFNPLVLLWYKKNRPLITRGQLSLNFFKKSRKGIAINFLMKYLMLNFLTKPDFIAYDHRDRKNLSLWILKKLFKIPLVAYTIKSQSQYEKNVDIFDLFIFDSFALK
jgi:glycerophosphoryl diester phosphodiesterase